MSEAETNPPPNPEPETGPASQTTNAHVRLTIAADQSAAIVIIGSGASPELASAMALTCLAEERGLARTPELAAAIESVAHDFLLHPDRGLERTIATGTPPVHGIDGRLELEPRFDPQHQAEPKQGEAKAHATKDDATRAASVGGRIDHHARQTFVAARRGDVLGRIVPPIHGREGINVLGRALNPREARALKLVTDETVTIGADGTITAAADGMVVLDGSTLRISSRLEVRESVDFSTGNIDFPGDVVVHHGVRDCFTVHAGRCLSIHGLVESASISAGLDITLDGGMAGRQKGTAHARRDLTALYLEQVIGRVGRDLHLGKEATHTTLNVGRAIVGPAASVIGGDICVGGQAELAQIGSDAGAATKIAVGHCPEISAALNSARALLERVTSKHDAVMDKVRQINSGSGTMTATQAEELTCLEFEAAGLESQAKKLRDALSRMLDIQAANGEPILTVSGTLWPGVRLWIGAFVCEPRHAVRGPLKIRLNEQGEPQLVLKTSGATAALSSACRVTHDDRFADRAAIAALVGHVPSGAFSDEGVLPANKAA